MFGRLRLSAGAIVRPLPFAAQRTSVRWSSSRAKVMGELFGIRDTDIPPPLDTAHLKPDDSALVARCEPVRLFSSFTSRVFLCHPNLDAKTVSDIRLSWPQDRLSTFGRRIFDANPPLQFTDFARQLYTPRTQSEIEADELILSQREELDAKSGSFVNVPLTQFVPCAINIPLAWFLLTNNPRTYQPFSLNPNTPTPATATATATANTTTASTSTGASPPPYDVHRLYALLPRMWFENDSTLTSNPIRRAAFSYPPLRPASATATGDDALPFLDLSACADIRLVDYWIVSLLRESTAAFRVLAPARSVTPLPPNAWTNAATATDSELSPFTFPVSIGYGVRTLTPYEWYVSQPWNRAAASTATAVPGIGGWRSPLYHAASPLYIVSPDGSYANVRHDVFTAAIASTAATANGQLEAAKKFESVALPGRWTLPQSAAKSPLASH